VQAVAEKWYDDTATRALEDEVDLLIVDGRNPRSRLTERIHPDGLWSIMDLFLNCDIDVAARRSLGGGPRHNKAPTNDELESEMAALKSRRETDTTRADNPMRVPIAPVEFAHGKNPHEATWKAIDVPEPWLPTTIYIDTTRTSRREMHKSTIDLAQAALQESAIARNALESRLPNSYLLH
jgi:hypothetical protein